MTEGKTATDWIVFDAVEIDIAGRRVFVDGVETPLEPKAFAVLALLAGHPGKAFARDEILDTVWGHRHVTPGVLNRVVTLIRQALGESADVHRYLHTLHGIGYRFDATVQREHVRPGTTPNPEVGIASDVLPTHAAVEKNISAPLAAMNGQSTSSPAASSTNPHSTNAVAPETPAEIIAPASALLMPNTREPTKTRFGARVVGMLALVVLIMVAGYWVLHRGAPAVSVAAAPVLVVLPLRAVGESHDDAILAEGLSEELITRLARIDGLRLISSTSATRAQEDKLDLNQLSERLHVTHALEGSLRQSEEKLRIDLRLIDIPSGRTLWAQDFDRSFTDVFAIQSEIAQSVAATLTLKLGLQNTAVERDPLLFRDYLEIRRQIFVPTDQAGSAQTLSMLRALVARAPDYARAHGLLARALVHELRVGLVSAADNAEAVREAARALELDPDQIEAHTALATIACRANEWAQCFNGFNRVLTLIPTDTFLRATYAKWLASIGYLDEALGQLEIGVASDPLNYETNFVSGRVLDTLGRHDAARLVFDATVSLAPDGPTRMCYARWYNAIWRGDFTAAREFAAVMPASEHFRDAYVGATEALLDPARWQQVEPLIEASEQITKQRNFLRLLEPNPDFSKVIATLENVLKTGSSSYNLLLWNPEFVTLRRDPAFQDFLRRTHIIDYWRAHGWPPQCKPEGDSARCD